MKKLLMLLSVVFATIDGKALDRKAVTRVLNATMEKVNESAEENAKIRRLIVSRGLLLSPERSYCKSQPAGFVGACAAYLHPDFVTRDKVLRHFTADAPLATCSRARDARKFGQQAAYVA